MKVCIYGAGAIGGLIGAHLAQAGTVQVSAVARGQTLTALRDQGWRVRREGIVRAVPAHAVGEPADLGVQDVVIIAVKAPALAEVADRIAPLVGPQTMVVPAMNGVPWWFGEGYPEIGTAPLASVDPDGRIARAIPLAQVVGCVVHIAASLPEPGLVEHTMGLRLILGEPAGGVSARVQRLAGVLAEAGMQPEVCADVRREVWYKLWGNLTMNPVAALTGATSDRILDDADVRAFCSAIMREAAAIGARLGCRIDQDPEERHAVTRRLGGFKASMLQDVQAGRAIELDSIVTVVQELGRRLAIPTPNVNALLGLTRLMAQTRGLYPAA